MDLSAVRPHDWTVLQTVQRLGTTSQHKLAQHLGRQHSTVNGAVQRLLTTGWLTRAGQVRSGRGRPAILFSVAPTAGCFAGIDITADELHCAVVAADGCLLEHASSRLGADRALSSVLDQIDLTLRGLMSRAGLALDDCLGVWAGINGAVDDRGVVVTCASLGWRNEPLRGALAEKYGPHVLVQGGAAVMNAAAEALMGAGRDAESLAYYHAGRGISARFVQGGRPLSGATQRAGELGHVVVERNGPRCACGNKGCLEAVASGPAIVSSLKAIPRGELPEPVRKLLYRSDGPAAARIVRAAFQRGAGNSHDPVGALLARVTDHLALGAAMVVAAYDPEVLVLGGYLFEDNPVLRHGVQRALERMVLDCQARGLKVVQGQVLTRDRALGGAAEMCQRFWANPRGVVPSR